MPYSPAIASRDLVIPRGIVHLSPLPSLSPSAPTYAYRDFGNCPGVSLTTSSEKEEHRSSRGGVRFIDDSTTIEISRTGNLSCDSVDIDTLAMFFFAEATTVAASSSTDVAETIVAPINGRLYQLGVDANTRPNGHRKISNVTVEPAGGGTAYVVNTDYQVDEDRGLLFIPLTSTISGNIAVEYDVAATTRKMVAAGDTEKAFTMLFMATNPKGAKIDYWLPFVRFRPSGELSLVAESGYQTVEFEIEALPLGNLAAVYMNGQAVAA